MNIAPAPRPAAFFVGDHLALDFLNSVATAAAGGSTEWLVDGIDLVDWLEQAGAIEPGVAVLFRLGDRPALDRVAVQARDLRDWLHGFVRRHEGKALGPDATAELAPLNQLLARDDNYLQIGIDGRGHGPHSHRVRRWTTADQLLQPLAAAIADLVCHADFRLIRTCEGVACTLVFLDKTKAHGRRWCSMAVCGNRAKVAAHRARAGKRAS
ncbi:MAG TPA: ABATE domain-containing protein [Aliidongia sp.]|uniref:CGNR zinc finger domain-containing protein n=1 Tax=Aliidongia sp. TaxID=1914230 RepID=UPI002DDCBFBB|nr:ABATE domain-containing protein [Aliidongia sp.]HEV2674842.1 ABATE domain-containing protein [Aliidongia sp.]